MYHKLLSTICIGALLLPAAAEASEFYDAAEVVAVTPLYERLYAPGDRCNHPGYVRMQNEMRQHDFKANPEAAIFGALLGGALGSGVGKGKGKDAATALGAVLGAHIAAGGGEFTGEKLLGAIVGGVAGSNVGGGSGRTAATAAGALAGAALAEGLVSNDRNEIARYCGRSIVSRRVITAYEVDFEYEGELYTTELEYEPDDYVEVVVHYELEVLDDTPPRYRQRRYR